MATFIKRPIPIEASNLDAPLTLRAYGGEWRGKVGDYIGVDEEGTMRIWDKDSFEEKYIPHIVIERVGRRT